MTTGARIWPISGVSSEVYHQSGSLSKPFLAVGALMRFFSGMCASMNTQIVLRDKPFTTEIADMRFLSCMLAQMYGQIRLTRDSFATNWADIFVLGACVSVRLHVYQQYLLPGETLVAELAMVFSLRWYVIGLMQLRV